MKRTSLHIENMCIKQLCSHRVGDFAEAFRVLKLFGNFEKRAPMFVELMFLFRVLVITFLLLLHNTMDNVSPSGLNTKTLLQIVKIHLITTDLITCHSQNVWNHFTLCYISATNF